MTVRSTLIAVFLITLVAFSVVAGVFYSSLGRLTTAQELTSASTEDLALYLDLTAAVDRVVKESADALGGDKDQARQFLEAKGATERKFDELNARFLAEGVSPERRAHNVGARERLAKVQALFDALTKQVEKLHADAQAGVDIDEEDFDRLIEQDHESGFLGAIDDLLDKERAQARAHVGEALVIATDAKRSGAVAILLGLIVLGVLAGRTLQSVDRGIQALVEGAKALASGDLTIRVRTKGPREIDRIAVVLNHMAQSLSEAHTANIRVERLSAVGQAAASVGHDLRNPLGAIRNANHYIRRKVAESDLRSNERVAEFMKIIDRELDTSSKIITDLLDFSRDRRPTLSACALRSIVAEAISVVAPPRPTTIENLVPEDLPLLTVDEAQIRQAVVNLVQNATEAVPERDGRVEIRAAVTGREVTLSIIDNGPGIPEEQRARLFEPFFTTKAKGTGLGLAITAGVIERHKGKIVAQPAPGGGTMFVIKLPIKAERPQSLSSPGEVGAKK